MRAAPRVWIGLAVYLTYLVAVVVVQVVAGAPFARGESDSAHGADLWSTWVLAAGVVAVALAVLITVLGWWRAVIVERPRSAHRWPAIAPVLLALAAVVTLTGLDGGAADVGLLASLLVAAVLIALCDELVVRGILLVSLRTRHREGAVWLLSSLLFAALYGAVALAGGGALGSDLLAAAGQFGLAFLLGTCLYITRRLGGSLIWAIALHALWLSSAMLADAVPGGAPIGAVVAGMAGTASLLAVPWAIRRTPAAAMV